MTITLPPELEQAVEKQAQFRGTTAELIAIDTLRNAFLPPQAPPDRPLKEGEETMADFLKDFIGCIDSSEFVPGGAQMSEDTGKKFTQIVVEKHRRGNL